MDRNKLEVGGKIFVKWNRSWKNDDNPLKEFTISKIGRKWAYFGNEKFNISTGDVHGYNGNSSGKAYESEECYKANLRRLYLIKKIRESLNYGQINIDLNQAESIAKILGIEIE